MQLPPRHFNRMIGQVRRLAEELTQLQRIYGLALGDQLGNHCLIAPPVAMNRAPLEVVMTARRRFETVGPVDEELLLAADEPAVELEYRISSPYRPDQIGGADSQAGLLGDLARGSVGERLTRFDRAADREPPQRRAG